jgi:hypothetical protein
MIDALLRLFEDGIDCCRFYQTIISRCADTSTEFIQSHDNTSPVSVQGSIEGLNPSQLAAVNSSEGPLSLIWGPPGLHLFLSSYYRPTIFK